MSLHRHWGLVLAVLRLFQHPFAFVQCILVCKITPWWKFKCCTCNNTSAAAGGSRCSTACVQMPALGSFCSDLCLLFFPHSEPQSYFPFSGEGKMLCRWQQSVEGLAHRAGEAHCVAGLSLSHERGKVVAPTSSSLNWEGWSSQTTPAEVELAFMQQLGGGCGRLNVIDDSLRAWRTGLNPPNVVHGARVKLLIFFLSIIRGIKWNLIGALALSCPQCGSCRADTASTAKPVNSSLSPSLSSEKQTNKHSVN